MAKLTGKLFGCSLAIGLPFYSQTVSLIGFSLGCQVLKSILKMLHTLDANDIIQNVTFMGAAVDVLDKPKLEPLWTSIFSETLSGTIVNAYSTSDAILLFYSAS